MENGENESMSEIVWQKHLTCEVWIARVGEWTLNVACPGWWVSDAKTHKQVAHGPSFQDIQQSKRDADEWAKENIL